ncbi:MAG: hypothetical protein KGJ86_18800, partial [Chloroflexota bacterium]|nr:hypothetical protein [Chloroflexota bacterium]
MVSQPLDTSTVSGFIALDASLVKKPLNPTLVGLQRTIRNPMGMFGVAILGVLVLTAIFAPFLAPYDPIAQHPGEELLGPGGGFLLGT